MASLTLPSGLVVETHEPTYGELVHIVKEGADDLEALLYAKYALIVPGLSREQIFALDRADGFALQEEMTRIWDGRPEEEAIPLGDGSTLQSEGSNRRLMLRPPLAMASTEWPSWQDGWIGHLKTYSPSAPKSELSANGSAGEVAAVTSV